MVYVRPPTNIDVLSPPKIDTKKNANNGVCTFLRLLVSQLCTLFNPPGVLTTSVWRVKALTATVRF